MLYIALTIIFLHFLGGAVVVGAGVTGDSESGKAKIVFSLFFIPVFVKLIDIRRLIEKKQSDGEKQSGEGKKGKGSAVKKFLISAALNFLKLIKVRRFDAQISVGTGDAAVTAMTVGGIRAGVYSIANFFGCAGDRCVMPDYDIPTLCADVGCIISFTFADIIYAAVCAYSAAAKTDKRKKYGKSIARPFG